MTRRQDLEEEWLIVAELSAKKLGEIRELLSISSKADAEEVLRITKWWQKIGDGSIPAKLKNKAHRLLHDFYSLNEASIEKAPHAEQLMSIPSDLFRLGTFPSAGNRVSRRVGEPLT
jgi:hypothetical protein